MVGIGFLSGLAGLGGVPRGWNKALFGAHAGCWRGIGRTALKVGTRCVCTGQCGRWLGDGGRNGWNGAGLGVPIPFRPQAP